jgi:hypothetical protein
MDTLNIFTVIVLLLLAINAAVAVVVFGSLSRKIARKQNHPASPTKAFLDKGWKPADIERTSARNAGAMR